MRLPSGSWPGWSNAHNEISIPVYWLQAHAAIVVISILVVITATLILQQQRTPQSILAWLLFVMLVPYMAIPLFMALGFRKQQSTVDPLRFELTETPATLEPTASQLDSLLRDSGLPGATTGHQFKLLGTGVEAHTIVQQMIVDAHSMIDVQMYVLGNDPVGRQFVKELESQARAGIAVRVLLDRIGTWHRPRTELQALAKAGGQIRYSSPLLHAPFKGHINLRNHRKLVMVDKHTVFSGGMNIAEEYLGPTPLAGRWHDCAYRMQGPSVESFSRVFESDWRAAAPAKASRGSETTKTRRPSSSKPDPDVNCIAQLAASGPDMPTDALHDALVLTCYRANERIWLVTPYFLPTPALMDALASAVHRGIQVRIVVPDKSNQWTADLSRGAYLRSAADSGCEIYRFMGGMVHAKLAITDDIGLIGSANFDMRSLLLNFEASLLLYSAKDVCLLSEWIEALLPQCNIGIAHASRARHALERVLSLGAPLL